VPRILPQIKHIVVAMFETDPSTTYVAGFIGIRQSPLRSLPSCRVQCPLQRAGQQLVESPQRPYFTGAPAERLPIMDSATNPLPTVASIRQKPSIM
jgi:hypothetical protein